MTNLESSVGGQPRTHCTKEALFTDSALRLNTWRIHLGCKGKASGENIIWWLEHERKDRIWPKLPEAKLLLGRNMCFYGI